MSRLATLRQLQSEADRLRDKLSRTLADRDRLIREELAEGTSRTELSLALGLTYSAVRKIEESR